MQGSIVARRYRITDTIGAGGMGSVYEAVDLQTGCEVALKALQPGAYDPIRLKRLRREARTMTAVRSQHVCKVHYLGVERGTPFIVMERLHGETLRTRLRESGPLSAGDAVAIACQLLDALTATHDAGLIHRDVKPSNVFLTSQSGEEPYVKLIDFGLAKLIRSADASSDSEQAIDDDLTSAEMISGTLHFLAPEQLLSAGELDERVDVYAAGVTLFEMLTGHRPFKGTYSDVVRSIVFNEPPSVTASRPDLPPVFDDVLAMAMAKSRDRRFASAQAFKRALLSAWDQCDQDSASLQSGVFQARSARNHEPEQLEVTMDEPELTMVDEEMPTLRPPPMVGLDDLHTSDSGVLPCFDLGAEQAWNDDDAPTLRPIPAPAYTADTGSWPCEAVKWVRPSGLDLG
jgi:eukaryotic-like serine/threonine-protein kinase